MGSGKNLKMLRVRSDLTQRQVAAAMGLSRQTVYTIEHAASVDPERENQYRAAVASLTGKGETA